MKKLHLTHLAKAEARIATILGLGEILTVKDYRGATYTVGPWTPAVGPRGRFAVYGYPSGGLVSQGDPAREDLTATEAAGVIVSRIGAGRARDAALAADRRARRSPGRVIAVPAGSRGQRVAASVVYDARA